MSLWLAMILGSCMFAQAPLVPAPRFQRAAPQQPLPFSHKAHVALKLECAQCHPMPEPGDFARLPATSVCMSCHIAIKKDSPHIAKLAEAHKESKKIPWASVYRIPDYVSFNHKKHVSVDGVTCETCHGPVRDREVLHREKDIGMQACMDCHRAKGFRNECNLCHDQR